MINPLKNTEIVKERYRGIRRHALITKEIRRKLPKLYSQNGNKNPMVYLKLFSPYSNWTLYVTEFDGKETFFGYVTGTGFPEWGYSNYKELAKTNRNGLPLIERDMYFKPKRFNQIKK